jgi:N-acetylneuraminic acid mutarotase
MSKTNRVGTIVVTNPNGLSDSFDSFTIQALTPILEDRTPSSALAGSGDFTLSILAGLNYTTNTVVRWDVTGTPVVLSTTYINQGSLMAAVPGTLIQNPGMVQIGLQTPPPLAAGQSGISTSLPFFIDSGSPFGLTSRYPSDGSPSRTHMQQGQLSDGRLITAGGRNTFDGRMSFAIMSLAEVFDPTTNNWTRIANMIFPREDHTLTMLSNGTYDHRYAGEAIVIGGRGLKRLERDQLLASRTAEMYDPSTDTWRRLADLQFSHVQHTTTRLNDGRLLVVGGKDEKGQVNSVVEVYDPNANKWTTVANLVTPRAGHRAVLHEDGRVAIIGGANKDGALASIEIFDPQTNTWSDGGQMQQSRADHTATLLKDGGILIVGGEGLAARSSAEIYNPQTHQSSSVASPSSERAEHSATLLADGTVLITGGRTGQGELQAGGEIFNPATMRWQRTTEMMIPRADHVTSQLKDGRVIVTGSGFSPQRRSSYEVYNPIPISN